jgi:amino acid adenylation domain-containing protein
VNRAIARIREELKVEVSLRKFFENPTIKELLQEVEVEPAEEIPPIERASRDGPIPLSFSQERLWFLHQLDEQSVSYHVPRMIRIRGKMDVSLFERTYSEIIRRHEIWRTVFPTVNGQPVQQILEPFEVKIPVIDWSGFNREEQERKTAEFVAREGRREFDFEKEILLRITMLKLAEEHHVLVISEHHLIHDGWTQGVMLKEFIAVYTAFSGGKPCPLPELPIQYADFAVWQRKYMQGERLQKHLEFWKQKLEGLPPLLELPYDHPRPPVMSGSGAAIEYMLPAKLSNNLLAICKANGVTLFMTMLAVFKILIFRSLNVETADICIGMDLANRKLKETEGMLGMVINTVPVRTEISGNLSFSDYLQRVKVACIEAHDHSDTPFEKIVEALQPGRSLSYAPLVQVDFSSMDIPTQVLRLPGLELIPEDAHNRSAKFDLGVIVLPPLEGEEREEIFMEWEYNTDIFEAATMERMTKYYQYLLEAAAAHPEQAVVKLRMLDEAETRQLLYQWNDTRAEYPGDKTLQQLFEEQAAKAGHRIALAAQAGQQCLAYRELDKRAGQLALFLKEKGVLPDTIVPIMVERSIEMMVGILGILKAGAAYLPIDPQYPEERLNYILTDSDAGVLVTTPGLFKEEPGRVEIVFADASYFSKFPASPFPRFLASHPSNLAYVIYTSGSTGKPKGSLLQHSSLVNRLHWVRDRYGLTEEDVILHQTTFTFDVSVCELFRWIPAGGKLFISAPGSEKDPAQIADSVGKYKITTMDLVPSMLELLLDYVEQQGVWHKLVSLKWVFTGVEPIKVKVVTKFNENVYQRYGTRLMNLYGPTEATVDVTYFDCAAVEEGNRQLTSIPVGKPMANVQVYILDRYYNLQPSGIAGELYIAGACLSRGYLNRPELTAEKFVISHLSLVNGPSPLSPMTNDYCPMTLYRTGDLARWLPDANIEFLGRTDFQVKIRGFRIELGEIENQLLKYPAVKEALVLDKTDKTGDKYLCAYITARSTEHGAWRNITELREYLAQRMPGYMVPSYFVLLDQIPLTPSGKIDRKALPEPDISPLEDHVAPRNEIEEKIAAIWSEVLGIEKNLISIDGNFFDLGGHSLKVTTIVSKMHKELGFKLQLMEIFKTPTIRGISSLIEAIDWVNVQEPGIDIEEESEEMML